MSQQGRLQGACCGVVRRHHQGTSAAWQHMRACNATPCHRHSASAAGNPATKRTPIMSCPQFWGGLPQAPRHTTTHSTHPCFSPLGVSRFHLVRDFHTCSMQLGGQPWVSTSRRVCIAGRVPRATRHASSLHDAGSALRKTSVNTHKHPLPRSLARHTSTGGGNAAHRRKTASGSQLTPPATRH